LLKDLNNTLFQYGEEDKKGVTDAFDLLQENVTYYFEFMLHLFDICGIRVSPTEEALEMWLELELYTA